jgi:hypothetical protein
MPTARRLMAFEYTASPRLYEALLRGKIPSDMDYDRWFVFAEDGWVSIHRAWSGFCIFQLRFEAVPAGYAVAEAWVNVDPAQNQSRGADCLRRILDHDLLHLWRVG